MRTILHLLSGTFLGVGLAILLGHVALFIAMRVSPDVYRWILHGPDPFNEFGSGPFMLWYCAFVLIFSVLFCSAGIAISVWLKQQPSVKPEAR
jgi:hypothetical protein